LKHWQIGLLGTVISLLAVWFFYTQVDAEQLMTALQTANYVFVAPCLVFLLLGLVARALRWRALLDGSLPVMRAFSIMNVAYLVNSILPFRVGEVARAYLASRAEPPVPVMKSASTIITERLLDLMAVIIMALFSLTVAPLPVQVQTAAKVLGPLAVIGFGVLVLLAANRGFTERLLAGIVERFSALERLNLQELAAHFLDGLAPLAQPRKLVGAVALTALSWALSAVAGYILMFAFYEQASWATTFLYIAAAAFAIAVPAVPGNVGTYEAAILLALNATGYAAYSAGVLDGTALSFAVMVHAVNLLVHVGTGIVGFVQEGVTLQQVSQGVKRIQQADAS
jgi:uncharacterized protein (TIRG00374 family)